MILLISTATANGFVGISREGRLIASRRSDLQNAQAAFVQPAIKSLLEETGATWKQLKAVAVSNGPGSYTGLRVGLASAKGLCFAHEIPLLCLSTTAIMAGQWLLGNKPAPPFFVAPMLDARRMEVYTAVYHPDGSEAEPPHAQVLTPESYTSWLARGDVYFFGDGAAKWEALCTHPNARFTADYPDTAPFMAILAEKTFAKGGFASLAYAEPFYTKDFYTPYFK